MYQFDEFHSITQTETNISPMNSSEEVKVLSERTLSISKYNEMSDGILKSLDISEYEDLHDYFILIVELKGEEYTFIHGYPENKPTGVFIYEDTEIIVEIEDGVASPEDHPLSKWYYLDNGW